MAIRGLDLFRQAFEGLSDSYVMIGGGACDLLMAEQGQTFRMTKDLDIMVIATKKDEFATALWSFLQQGAYNSWTRKDGRVHYYRFDHPAEGYPAMIELFSRHPDFSLGNESSEIVPLPFSEEISSLSAIVLDDDYYRLVCDGMSLVQGVSVLDAAHLIPLKMRAHIDLNRRKLAGAHVNSADLKKHRKDVIRLLPLVPIGTRVPISERLQEDVHSFIETLKEPSFRIDQIGVSLSVSDAVERLQEIYL